MAQTIVDHTGAPAEHRRATVNGVRLHYYAGGAGPALVLQHGVPKTSYFWRHVFAELTDAFTVVVPDMRGLGDSEHAAGPYDMRTVATDVAELMTALGHERFSIAGEDWGAAAAYQLAASFPDRVDKLIFQEMLLPGFGLEDWSALTGDNVASDHWLWHINFYAVPDVPELLLTGRERPYFDWFIRNEALDQAAITAETVDEYVRCYSEPGGLRCMFEIYRASLESGRQNVQSAKTKLALPVLAVGSEAFIGEEVTTQMDRVAEDVTTVLLDGGHQLAEERPAELAAAYRDFLTTKPTED